MSIFIKKTQKGFTGESARDKALLKEVIGKASFGKSAADVVEHKASQAGYFIASAV